MTKKIFQTVFMTILIVAIAGCGKIPEEARETEKNYKQMLEESFKSYYDKEFIIEKDEVVKGSFIVDFQEQDTTEHIIDATLKDDPSFSFRICTGFSEVPTFRIVYDFETNYKNFATHRDWTNYLQNNDTITLKSQLTTQKHYSKCTMDVYDDQLVFNSSKSVEEIAPVLFDLFNHNDNHYSDNVYFTYGDIHSCLHITYYNSSIESYMKGINKAIDNAKNADGVSTSCAYT